MNVEHSVLLRDEVGLRIYRWEILRCTNLPLLLRAILNRQSHWTNIINPCELKWKGQKLEIPYLMRNLDKSQTTKSDVF